MSWHYHGTTRSSGPLQIVVEQIISERHLPHIFVDRLTVRLIQLWTRLAKTGRLPHVVGCFTPIRHLTRINAVANKGFFSGFLVFALCETFWTNSRLNAKCRGLCAMWTVSVAAWWKLLLAIIQLIRNSRVHCLKIWCDYGTHMCRLTTFMFSTETIEIKSNNFHVKSRCCEMGL